jgi:hypothetical protein
MASAKLAIFWAEITVLYWTITVRIFTRYRSGCWLTSCAISVPTNASRPLYAAVKIAYHIAKASGSAI